eukprot:scaffold15922_cov111-Isochrysis_galbana.AAC.3
MRTAPSNRSTSPLRYRFRMTDSTKAPNSSGRPKRLGKGMEAASPVLTSSFAPSIIGVSNTPGAIVTTRIPRGARSRAMGNVIPTIAPLDAA